MKKLIRATTAAVLFSAIPLTPALSMTSTATTTTAATAGQAQRLANLKSKGGAEIDRRLANLNAALQKLEASTKLSAVNKAALTKQIQDEVAGLTSLKAKLEAETTLAAARTDVQSIVTDYRVYALMLPKARMVASNDRFEVAEAKLSELATKLQDKITAQKAAGRDVKAMQASLDDMKAKLASARTRTAGLTDKLLALKPTDYNANRAVLVSYRDALKAALADLKAARTDAKTIIDALKAAN